MAMAIANILLVLAVVEARACLHNATDAVRVGTAHRRSEIEVVASSDHQHGAHGRRVGLVGSHPSRADSGTLAFCHEEGQSLPMATLVHARESPHSTAIADSCLLCDL